MNIYLKHSLLNSNSAITITGSKSETNRMLLLQALFPGLKLENTSNSDDSEVMRKALSQNPKSQLSNPNSQLPNPNSSPPSEGLGEDINVHHAGTAMRFLTAYFAIQPNREVVLTGSRRMKERPIKILVEALQQLGAEISYEENQGLPPIRIKGRKLSKNKVSLPAGISSQYISALLLIAPKLQSGLELTLEGEITSVPYIKMTLELLNEIGVETTFVENIIAVKPLLTPNSLLLTVESDWSSASYFYSLVALSAVGTAITLSSFKKPSIQGDSVLAEIYQDFGVQTLFNTNNSITISKISDNINGNINDNFNGNINGNINDNINGNINDNINGNINDNINNKIQFQNIQTPTCQFQQLPSFVGPDASGGGFSYNLQNTPDIAQTIAVTCFGMGIGCNLTGLHTLKIKETDRLEALKTELTKLGATISVTGHSLHLAPHAPDFRISQNVAISTYQDHRMAMAFAPLSLKISLIIEKAEVVSKSYPDFWNDLKTCGILMSEEI